MSSEHVGVTRYVVAAAALATSAACVYKLQSRSRSCHAAASQSCNNETRRRRRDLQDSQEAVRCHRRRRRSDADESGEAPKGFLASLLPWCWATCRTGNGAVDKSSHYCCVCSNANDEDEEPEANGFGANTGAPSDDIVAVLQQLQDGPFGFGGANVKVLSSKKREERRRRRRGRRPHMRGKSSPPTTALPTRSSGRGQESRQQRQSRHASATLLANRGSPASEALLGSPTSMLLEPHSSSPTISLTESPTTPTSATLSDSCYDSFSTDAGTDGRDSITSSLCASLDGGRRRSCSASPAGSVPPTQDNSPPPALAHTRTAQYLPPQATHHTPARTYPPMGSDNSGRNGSYAHHHHHHVNGGYNSNANMPIPNAGTDGASVDEEEERLEAFARWAGSSTVSSAVAARFILRPQQQQQSTTAATSSAGRESYIPLSTLASGTAGGTGYVGNAAAAWAINSFASRGGGGGFGDGHSGDTGKKRSAWSRVHRALRPLRRVVRSATRKCLWCAAFLWSVPFAATASVVRSLMSWLRRSLYDEVVNRAEEAADPAMHDGDGSSNNNDNDDEQGGLDERLNAFTSAILERLQHDTDLHKQIDELLEPLQPTPGRVPSVAIVRAPLLHDTSADVRSLWKAIKQDPTVSEDDLVDVVVMSTVDPSSPEAAIARDGRGGAGRAVAGGGGGGVSWNPFTSPLSHDNMSSFGPSPSGMSGGGGMSPVFLPSGLSGGTFGQTARDVADDGGGGSVAPSKNRSTSSEERKPLSSISTTTDQSSHDGGSDKEDGRGGGSGGSSPYSAVRSVEVRNEVSFQIVPAYTYYAYLARCCVLQEKDNVIFTRLPSLLHHIERCALKRAGLSSDRFSHSTNLNVTLPFPSPLVAPAAATAAEAPRASPPPPPLVREAVRVHGVGVPAVLAPRATSTDALPNAAALPPSLISSTPRGGGSGVSLNTMTTVSGDAHSSSSATNLDVDTFLSVWQGGRNEPFLMSAPSAACQPSELPTKSTNPSSSSMRDLWKQFSSSVAKTLRSPTSMLASPLGRSVPVVVPPQSFAYAAAVVNDEEDDNEGSTPEVVPLCMTPSSPGAAARVGSVGGGGGGVAASSMKQRAATAAGEGEQGAGARQIVLTVRSLDYLSTGGLGTSKHTTHFDLSPPTPSPGLYNRGSNGARYRHRRLHSHHSHRTPHAAPQQHLGLQSPETGANDSIDVSIDSARQGGEATTNSHNGDPMEPFGPLPVRDHTAVLPTDITDGTGRTRAIAGTGGGGSMPVYTPDASPHPFRRLQPGSDAALDGEQHQQAMALSQHDSSHYRHSTVSTLSPKQLSALALSPPLGASVSVTTATSGATRTPPARAVSGKNASVLSVLASPFANFFQQPQAQQQQQQQHRQQQHLPLRSASDIQRQRFSISLLKLTGRSQRMLDDMEALLKRVREHWQTALTELRQETLKVLVSTERIGHLDGEALQAELLLRAERVLRESVLPLFTLGMARREEMREGLMEELEDTSFTVCAIPLPDQRVYRNVPPAVPRHIAAHARGFPLEHTFAEEILHQQRVLQGILIALEEHQHRKYVRRERRRVLRQQAKAARRTKRSSRLLPPPLRHAWQSIRRFARSSDARGGSEHHMGNGSGDGLLGSPTAEEGGLAAATATVAAEDCLCGAGKVCLKCEVAGTRHRAGGYRRHQNLFPVLQPSPAAADTTPTATPVHESVSNGSGGGVATRGPSMGVAVPQAFQGRGTTTTTLHASTTPRIQVPTLSTPVSDPTLKYTTFPPEGLETPPLSDPADFAGGSAATIGHNGCDDSNGNSDTSHALWGGGGGRASPESRWEQQQQQQQPTLFRQPPPGEALRSGSGGLGRGLRSVRSSSMGLVNLADAPLPSYGGATTGSGTGTLAAAAPSLDPAKRAGTPRSGATTADTSTVVGLTPPLASLPGADSDQVPSSSSNHHHHHGNGENSAAVEEARQQRGYWVETITATNLARGGDLSGGANGTSPGSATVASSSSSPSGGGMHSPLPGIGGRTPPVLGLSVPTMGLGAGGGGGLCDSASLSAPLTAAPYNALASGFPPSSRTDQSEAASARSVHRPTRSHDSQCTDAATTNHQTDTNTGLGGTSEVSYRPPVPNNSMYGTYDAYYGHTVAAPQAVLLRQQALMEVSEANRRARAKQEKRRRRSTAITTAGAGGGGGGGGTLTPFAADFAHPHPSSADRHHQQQQQQTTEAARHRYSRPMEEPPLTHYERVRRTTSLDSLGATGAVPGVGATSPSPAAHRHSAASSLTSIPVTLAATQLPASRYPHTQQDDDDPQQHPHHSEEDMNATQSPLLRYSHNLFDLLGTGGGPMYSGITYYYTFGDSAAGLFNSSIQPRPELTEAWETFNEEEAVGDAPGDAGERRCGAAFRVTGSAPASTSTSIVSPTSGKPGKPGSAPPVEDYLPVAKPLSSRSGGADAAAAGSAARGTDGDDDSEAARGKEEGEAVDEGCSYFYEADAEDDEEARELQRQDAAREERNRHFYSLFRHLHRVYYDTVLRVPPPPPSLTRRSVSATMGRTGSPTSTTTTTTTTADGRVGIATLPPLFPSAPSPPPARQGGAPSLGSSPGSSAGFPRPVSPQSPGHRRTNTSSSPRGGGSSGDGHRRGLFRRLVGLVMSSSGAALGSSMFPSGVIGEGDAAAQGGSGGQQTATTTKRDCVTFAARTRRRSELNVANGNYGLTPLEVWLACRYSRKAAAEVYVMDINAQKGDPYFPAVRVVDEVVAHAVLYYHNRSLRDFLEELGTQFGLYYEPRTLWGRIRLGYPVTSSSSSSASSSSSSTSGSSPGSVSPQPHPASSRPPRPANGAVGSCHASPLSISDGAAAQRGGVDITQPLTTSPRGEEEEGKEGGLDGTGTRSRAVPSPSTGSSSPLVAVLPTNSPAVSEGGAQHKGSAGTRRQNESALVGGDSGSSSSDEDDSSHTTHPSPSQQQPQGSHQRSRAEAARGARHKKRAAFTVQGGKDKLFKSGDKTLDMTMYYMYVVDEQEDGILFLSVENCLTSDATKRLPTTMTREEEREERMLMHELRYLKEFLLENRNVLSSASLTPTGSNRLEGVFGAPSTVFPFLQCARESVGYVQTIHNSLQRHYGLLSFEGFAKYASDVFSRDHPEIIRHAPRIFRTLNRSRRGHITYDELCSWMGRKLSCGSNLKPDAHLLATTTSLRLPLTFLLDSKEEWTSTRECALHSLSDGDGDF